MSKNLIENIQKNVHSSQPLSGFCVSLCESTPIFWSRPLCISDLSNIRIAPVPAPHMQTNKGPSGAPDYHPLGEQDLSQLAKPFPISIFYETGQ